MYETRWFIEEWMSRVSLIRVNGGMSFANGFVGIDSWATV